MFQLNSLNKIFKLIQICSVLILINSCRKEVFTKKFEVGNISFNYTSDWLLIEPKTIDSYYSLLINKDDTLYIRYGMYNQKLYKEYVSDNLIKQVSIGGRQAVVEIPKTENGFYSIYIPKVDSLNGLILNSNRTGNSAKMSEILSTLKINNSIHTTINLDRRLFLNQKKETGVTNYEKNCLSCHSEFQKLIGPPLLKKFFDTKDKEWLTDYLYKKKIECFYFAKKDSIIVKEMVEYLKQ